MATPQRLPSEFLQNLLLSILDEEGFDANTMRYEVLPGVNGAQENWLSSVYKVAVYPDKKTSAGKVTLFFKCLLKSTMSQAFRNIMFFKNEVSFYQMALPALLSLQEQRRDHVTTPVTGVPRCFSALSDGENDVVVLEDLTTRGFVMPNRLVGLTLQETRLMFEELGRYHALSFAMKDQNPVGFAKIRKSVSSVLFVENKNDTFRRVLDASAIHALKLMKEKYPSDSSYVTKTQVFVDNVGPRMMVLTSPGPDDRYNVVNHGDVWINNFMYHHVGVGAERRADAVCMLDFQIACYANIGTDLSCALYTIVDQSTRDEHRDALLHAYHDALCKLLAELGSDPQAIFPFSAVEEQLAKFALFGIGFSFMNVPSQLHELEEPDMDGPDAAVQAMIAVVTQKTDVCKKWIVDMVVEAVDRGYFD